jgi:hypothetical protein
MAKELTYGTGEQHQLAVPGIPDDEPVFVVRAADLTSSELLRVYGLMCGQAGASQAHIDSVAAARDQFRAWAETHETEICVPGAHDAQGVPGA